jgi:hypothetical protein
MGSKKSKRKFDEVKVMTELSKEAMAPTADANPGKPAPTLTSVLLKDVRAAALKATADAHHNIAELESWRNEIDATIAFLRAQRK